MHPLYRRILFLAIAMALVFFITKLVRRDWDKPASGDTNASPTIASAASSSSPSAALEKLERTLAHVTLERDDIASLRAAIQSSSKSDAIAFVRVFLATGKDRTTGMEFEIAADGSLKTWPTLRTMVLDLVSTIDPAAAADIAREILAKPTTADEWALALRNLGRIERSPENDRFLLAKTTELIRNSEWQAAPSVGYLNSFDLLVHLEATSETPLLSGLVQNKDRKDLAHAAFLTLDRLVQRQPVEMLAQLAADTALQQARPEMAAQQFARADLRIDAQRELVKSWLLNPARTPAELRSFAGVYPNNNHFVSNNLITTETTQSGSDLAAHDREALKIIQSWQQDPAFQPIAPQLATILGRLVQFTLKQAPPNP